MSKICEAGEGSPKVKEQEAQQIESLKKRGVGFDASKWVVFAREEGLVPLAQNPRLDQHIDVSYKKGEFGGFVYTQALECVNAY